VNVEWIALPACATDSPASSMSWSMEKAPELMSSLSRAAAFLAERVWRRVSGGVGGRGVKRMDRKKRADILVEPC
jgi:hypothetical protein